MTNNYFKVYHYLSVLGLCVDEKMLLFFFDDKDDGSVKQALHAAEQCLSTIKKLTYGRRALLSVLRRLAERPDIPEIGSAPRVSSQS